MQQKEKASAQPLAKSTTKFLEVDLKEAERYSQPSRFPTFVLPKKCRLFLLPAWYYLREELGGNEAEILRDIDYWVGINFRHWKRPHVHWTYEKLANRIRIPKKTLQTNVKKLIKAKLLTVMGTGPLSYMINYDELLKLEKELMAKMALHDAKLATYLEGKGNH